MHVKEWGKDYHVQPCAEGDGAELASLLSAGGPACGPAGAALPAVTLSPRRGGAALLPCGTWSRTALRLRPGGDRRLPAGAAASPLAPSAGRPLAGGTAGGVAVAQRPAGDPGRCGLRAAARLAAGAPLHRRQALAQSGAVAAAWPALPAGPGHADLALPGAHAHHGAGDAPGGAVAGAADGVHGGAGAGAGGERPPDGESPRGRHRGPAAHRGGADRAAGRDAATDAVAAPAAAGGSPGAGGGRAGAVAAVALAALGLPAAPRSAGADAGLCLAGRGPAAAGPGLVAAASCQCYFARLHHRGTGRPGLRHHAASGDPARQGAPRGGAAAAAPGAALLPGRGASAAGAGGRPALARPAVGLGPCLEPGLGAGRLAAAPLASPHGASEAVEQPPGGQPPGQAPRSEEHTSELQSRPHLVCRLLLEKKKKHTTRPDPDSSPARDARPFTAGASLEPLVCP